MSTIPEDLRYAETHEWAREEADGTIAVGISDHAQEELGDVVYVELPTLNSRVSAKQECAVVESVKAASDIYAPVAGEIIAINKLLTDSPETLNSDPYGDGWIMRIKPEAGADVSALLDADGYLQSIEE